MRSKDTPELPSGVPRKPWHAPQCSRKTWSTPKFTTLEFSETRDGLVTSLSENSSGTVGS
jgi:hypothetical protein